MLEKNFIEKCLLGGAELEEIDAYVEYWHTHETNSSLQDFLGMEQHEYAAWMKYGNVVLRDILKCRVDETTFEE